MDVNLGITRQQYRVMKKNGEPFDFTCTNCQSSRTPSLNIIRTSIFNEHAKVPPTSLDIPEVFSYI